MLRTILGAVAAFFAWVIVWVSSEQALGAIWPDFGANQRAFEAALTDGTPFTPDTSFLVSHVVLGSLVSALSGWLAALIAGENKRAPLILAGLLLALGLLKLVMSWPYVPLWYHLVFTAMLMPMALLGSRLPNAAQRQSGGGTAA